nr:PREDICTED: murinoglobulin-1-like [Megachile rotundata]
MRSFKMDKFVFLVLCCFVGFLRCCDAKAVIRGYLFTAPKQLPAGETVSGCLSLHKLEPPAHILLELVKEDEVLSRTNTVLTSGIETCLELPVPMVRYRSALLRLTIKFDKYPHYKVNAEEYVEIVWNSLLAFVETDKRVYKSGQDVNIRILMLKNDLKPWKKPISKVWIENPSGIRVVQWSNVSTENGMAQLKFPLSMEPSLGTWSIVVDKYADFEIYERTQFEVNKYVLPRFQIAVTSPSYVLADTENVTWNICVRYSYGKPVKGTLLLKLTPHTPSWRRKPNLTPIRYETEMDSPDGCTEFTLSGTVLNLARWNVAPNNIVLLVNFTEAGTGVKKTTISRSVVKHKALKIEFTQYMPKYFKLDLPYHGKLRVFKQDDTPAPNEKIQLCLKVLGKNKLLLDMVECRDFTTSADGFVDFIVPPQQRNVILLSFLATAVDYPMKYYSPEKRWRVFMDQPSAQIDIHPWFSASNSYLVVTRGTQPIVCGEKYSFNVMYTMPSNIKDNESILFHYSINSKSGILIYGHVTHKPGHDTILNYSEFRNLLGSLKFSNRTDQDPVVHRFPLSVKVTSSMAPISELLLYYVRLDGEIVAATYTIEVGHCFENKVKTAWHTDARTPGSTTQYHVEAAPWSLCGISAVDKSTLFLDGSKSNLIDAAKTFEKLKYREFSFLTSWRQANCQSEVLMEDTEEEIGHLPRPATFLSFERRKRRSTTYNRIIEYVNEMQAFIDFGVIVMSDLKQTTLPCTLSFKKDTRMFQMSADTVINFAIAAAAKSSVVDLEYIDEGYDQTSTLESRSYFPETWLWELVPTGREGKITIERTLPHTITDWVGYTTCISPIHGLGIAPPTTITSFQPFFLDYSLPYSVKRGEMMRMKVSLFNYMQHSLPVAIRLEEMSGIDLHLSLPTASFCVEPRDSVIHEFVLRPRVIGEVNITVSAYIDSNYSEPCGPQTLVFTRDKIVKPLLILPEGYPMEKTETMLLCPMDFNDDSTFMWEAAFPEDVVNDSARGYVNLIGDILGPALQNLDNLVQLPRGCGEQNMVLFVPNLNVIKYLDVLQIKKPELRKKAIKNIEKGTWYTFYLSHLLIRFNFGGLQDDSSSTALTAYILIALVESGITLPESLVTNALNCLEKGMANGNDSPYATILTTYALALLGYPKVNASLKSVMDLATRSYNDLLWWEDKTWSSLSLSIEMTAYVILTLVKLGGNDNLTEALKAVRWISKQRNVEGGFKSTQDTILGLEAISEYAMVTSSKNTDLSVLLTAIEVDRVHRLYNDNRMVLTQIRLPVLPTSIEVSVEGEGCVLVQTNIKYNVAHATGSDAFDLSVSARSDAFANECAMQNVTICARYKLADGESNMALLEIGMISGYVPDRESLQSLLQPMSRVKRFEENNDVVVIYFDKLFDEKTCVSFTIIRENFVDYLEPANVILYDYYQQELMVYSNYKVPSMCSSAEPIDEQPITDVSFKLKSMRQPVEIELNSSFVDTKQEVAIPEGMEGPVPVYVKPETIDYKLETTIATNGLSDLTPTLGIEDQTVQWGEQEPVQEEFDSQIRNTTDIETDDASPTGAEQFCPVCMESLPSDFTEIYCSARSVVKAAIRRLRKTRMLLDLHASREVQRLRSAVEFYLSPNCVCVPLDTPASLALIINMDTDFLTSQEQKQSLNGSYHIYGLPPTSGVPCKVAEARSTCSSKETVQCT